jgi:hypothetical protein
MPIRVATASGQFDDFIFPELSASIEYQAATVNPQPINSE